MLKKALALAVTTATILSIASIPSTASAQSGAAGSVDVVQVRPTTISNGPFGRQVYSAKFLCGTVFASGSDTEFPAQAGGILLVPGTYLTMVNILNPNPGADGLPINQVFVSELGQTESVLNFLDGLEEETFDCSHFLLSQGVKEDEVRVSLQNDFFFGYLWLSAGPALGSRQIDVVGIYSFKNVEGQNVALPGPLPPPDGQTEPTN